MTAERVVNDELDRWIVEQVRAGQSPEAVVRPLLDDGWEEQAAIDAVEAVVRRYLDRHACEAGLPPSAKVPVPVAWNGPALIGGLDRAVRVLTHMVEPQIVVFGDLLGADECEALIALARPRLQRSTTVDMDTGGDQVHAARTSEGMCFRRGEHPLCRRIEARLAKLTGWPLENGEGLQILRYGPGAEYQPHYDYFDPEMPGSAPLLQRGGQRVASVVMYLNTPAQGGATVFPDIRFEVAPVRGNAVFFSYDRPHPITRSLHGGAPVLEGEKWIATKWLRERRHD